MAAPPPTLASVFTECAKALEETAYYNYVVENAGGEFRQSIMCRIFEALVDDDRGCNALGNNLNEAIDDVKEFLEAGPRSRELQRDVRDYLLRLYLVVERVYEALQVIGLREERYRLSTDGMRALREIKQWANFFKHPGAFLWCHSPTYSCLSLHALDPEHTGFILDQTVVNDHYVLNEKKQRDLHSDLSNAQDVLVVFPELIALTKRFCQGIDDFCNTISSPFFRDTLKKKSTIDNYFDEFYDALNDYDDSSDSCDDDSSSSSSIDDSSAAY